MTVSELQSLLSQNPDPECRSDFSAQIDNSLAYLSSDKARQSLLVDCYWPKWDSPWWHMLTLHEMGLAAEIPNSVADAMVSALQRLPLKVFPLTRDQQEGWDLHWDSTCHCAVGSIYAVLSAQGVKVDQELSWLRAWLPSYQMADGGMTCDPDAYQVGGQCPSSMVGLVPAMEALLFHAADWSEPEIAFLDRGAEFLIARQLRWGSSSDFNAEERTAALKWLKPCFPRLYLYDVLRGLHTLLSWALRRGRQVPLEGVATVVEHLAAHAPDGQMRIQRRGFEGVDTRLLPRESPPCRGQASLFPLLEATSQVGSVSPFLTRQWTECKRLLKTPYLLRTGPDSAVNLVPHSRDWSREAQEEAKRFAAVVGNNLVQIHHIGSTSIPGIWAKPVIDLAPEVHSLEALDLLKEPIEKQGYDYRGEYGLPGRRFCPRLDPHLGQIANLHCYQTGDPELHRHLAFRDFMRAFPARAAEYEQEKLRARNLHPNDLVAYNAEKNTWIRQVEKEALEWAKGKSQN